MGRPSSPMDKQQKQPRDYQRCCMALDLMSSTQLSSETIKRRYYQDVAESSFHKTFSRDRKELETEGLYLIERKQGSHKYWSVDKQRSFASVNTQGSATNTNQISLEECGVIAAILRGSLQSPNTADVNALGTAAARIGCGSGGSLQELPAQELLCDNRVLQRVVEGINTKTPLTLSYKSLADTAAQIRVLQPWGMFVLGQHVYVVGLRKRNGQEDAIRTLNLERVETVELLEGEPSFEVPASFSVADYRLLPFEIGNNKQQLASFFVAATQIDDFKATARKRGTFTYRKDGTAIWSCPIKNIDEAVRWALEVGVAPLSPTELTQAWTLCNEEVLHEN